MIRMNSHAARIVALGVCLATVLAFGSARDAAAVQLNTDAVVEVVNAPIVTETADLQFGQVLRPTSGTNDIRVSTAGVRTLIGAGNAVLLGGTVHAASYTIDAVSGLNIAVEAAFFSDGGSGMTLNNFTGSYAGNPAVGIDPADAASFVAVTSATLTVGGDLIGLATTTTPATHTLTFTLDVNYE